MKLSIVIITWNSEKHIVACLQSLISCIGPELKPFEVLVVDNGSTDSTVKRVKAFREKYQSKIEVTLLEKNMGTTYSRNLVLRQAKGDMIAILDSDVILLPNVLEGLSRILNKSANIGMVVPKLVYKSGRYQKSTDDFPTVMTKFFRYFFLKYYEESSEKDKTQPFDVDYAISAFWLIKKEILKVVGFLDEKIFYAPEDVDYCLRIWQANYRILYVPEQTAIHDAQEVSRGFHINRLLIEHCKGLLYYFRKHRYLFVKPKFNRHEV